MTRTNLKNLPAVLVLLLAALLFAYAPSPAHAGITIKSTASPGLNTGLVGYWSFEEGSGNTAYDKSGKGNTGILTNMALNAWVNGNTGLGTALSFDGVNDYVDTADINAIDGATALTVSAWVNETSLLGDVGIVVKWDYQTQGNFAFQTGSSAPGKLTVFLATSLSDNGVGSRTDTTNSVLTAGVWQHVVMVFDGSQTGDSNRLRIYVNGIAVSTTQGAGAVPASLVSSGTATVKIGKFGGTLDRFFNGSIDEVRIYNRALSQAEITRLYKLKKTALQGADQTGMVGWWKFDEGQGTNAGDSSGKGNTGTLTSMSSPPTATSGWGVGKFGKALLFDGVNDTVTIAHTAALTPSIVSLFAWVYVTATPGVYQNIIIKEDPTFGYQMFLAATTRNLTWYSDASAIVSSGVAVPLNTWTHVGIVGSGASGKFFINGVQVATGSMTVSTGSTGQLSIGAWRATSNPFNGKIDDVRVYNRALTAAEITKIYKEKAGVKIGVAPNNPTLNTGLVGYWNFDGKNTFPTSATPTTLDLSGNNNTGTLTNGPVPTIGKLGQALKFDGVDDYVAVSSSASLAPSNITVSFWAKYNAAPALYDAPLGKTNGVSWTQGWGFFPQSGTEMRFFVNFYATTASFTGLTMTNWNHFVGTWDGTTIRIYANGIQGTTGTNSGAMNTTNPFEIGRLGTDTYNINGSLDDVRIYNRALTTAEVTRLYNGGRAGN